MLKLRAIVFATAPPKLPKTLRAIPVHGNSRQYSPTAAACNVDLLSSSHVTQGGWGNNGTL